MTDWSAGYVSDIGYTYGYYSELNPQRLRLAFLNRGLVFPEVGTACELGFGQGLSANIHAAASVVRWSGTDFNPAQASFARSLAQVSGADAALYDESFADFCGRDDLPDFDYIGLHGIWSWISDENRALIVDFVRRRLKVGGVLYISYNTQPGWAAFAPMRHLMMEHARMLGAEGQGIVNRIDGAIAFAQRLLATNPAYARANPQIGVRMKKLESQNRHYLAHEYFNRDWHPMHFTTLARWLEPAKLQFACSAHFIDHVDAVNLTSEQQAVVNEVPDMLFCETVRDFMVNQQFRRDYWVKGQRRMSPLERAERLRVERVVLVAYRPDVSLKIKGALGDAEMSAQVYNPILDQLADHRVRSIGEIAQAVEGQGISFAQIVQAILILVGGGHLAVAQEDAVVQKAKKRTERLNAHLCMQARGSGDIGFLASPVTGGGLPVSRFEQLFLLAQRQGAKTPEDRARFVWRILDAQGQKLLKEGRTLKTPEENLAELADQARAFETRRLPILRALQII